MRAAAALLVSQCASVAFGQAVCPETPAYSPCDLVLEMPAGEEAGHSNPYLSVQLHGEFRWLCCKDQSAC